MSGIVCQKHGHITGVRLSPTENGKSTDVKLMLERKKKKANAALRRLYCLLDSYSLFFFFHMRDVGVIGSGGRGLCCGLGATSTKWIKGF